MTQNIALPLFTSLNLSTYASTLEALLSRHLADVDLLIQQQSGYTWDNLIEPLDALEDELERFWSPLSHLHAVVNTQLLRQCYQDCLPKLSAYNSTILQNDALYQAIKSIKTTSLNEAQRHILANKIRDFELSGVGLSADKKKRFEAIETALSDLSNQFENHVLDATQAFSLTITDESRLAGLPSHALASAKELAESKGEPGYVLNLEYPCYLAVMTYAEDSALREQFYQAFVTRASDQGACEFDNSPVMNQLLALRHEEAQLLGFPHYAALSVASKMASSCDRVLAFLNDLAHRSKAQAKKEFKALEAFAKSQGIATLAPWDIAFYTEKLSVAQFDISEEMLRPYFPVPKVLTGLFEIIYRLYGMTLEAVLGVETWHKDVTCYRVLDEKGQIRGMLYMDLYAREHKRGGAWMDSLQSRRRLKNNTYQLPIATLTCNFAKPYGGNPGQLSHDEVLTLFHEMGHCLHHLLTKVDYLSGSGINGVEWDAVELPSQFFENWCWEWDALQGMSEHVESKAPISEELYQKMLTAKHFQSAMAMMRQLEFSLFDFRIHSEYQSTDTNFIAHTLEKVRVLTALMPAMSYNRFQHSFTHIFAGGYAAGYYSYKWAEVLSADAFSRFEEEGIFNAKTGHDFLTNILEVGGSKPASEAFSAFRGRDADISALLRHNGILED